MDKAAIVTWVLLIILVSLAFTGGYGAGYRNCKANIHDKTTDIIIWAVQNGILTVNTNLLGESIDPKTLEKTP
jgi:hypothetical protein